MRVTKLCLRNQPLAASSRVRGLGVAAERMQGERADEVAEPCVTRTSWAGSNGSASIRPMPVVRKRQAAGKKRTADLPAARQAGERGSSS
jgi:hypothetical protein